MSKAQPKDQPSVEELLASIREAIYEDGEPRGGHHMTARKERAPQGRKGEAHRPARPAPTRAAIARPALPEPAPATGASAYNGGPQSLAPRGSMRGLRVSLEHGTGTTGRVSTRTDDFLALRERLSTLTREEAAKEAGGASSEGFAGILGGDVRLEEALARLSRAGRPPSDEIDRPLAPPAEARARPLQTSDLERLAGRELRPAVRDVVDAELQALSDAAQQPAPEPAYYPPEAGADWQQGGAAPPEAYADAGYAQGYGAPGPDYGYPPEAAGGPQGGYAPWPGGPYPPPAYPPQPMMAPEAADQTASAFNRLADTIMSQATGGERSIEDITRELLRPMLKSWLDHNLPAVVERLVREEIERVARRGGR
jgi:hypothetical protein